MQQVVKFFGWIALGVAVTLFIFGHISMWFVHDFNFMVETIFPNDPETISSIWYGLFALIPGILLFALSWLIGKYVDYEVRRDAEIADLEDDSSHSS